LIQALKRRSHPQRLRLIQFFQMKAMPKGDTAHPPFLMGPEWSMAGCCCLLQPYVCYRTDGDCFTGIYRSTMSALLEPTWFFSAFCEKCERNFRFLGQCRCTGSVAECRLTCPKCEHAIFCHTATTSVAALSRGQPNISEPREVKARAITSRNHGKGRHSTFVETADGR